MRRVSPLLVAALILVAYASPARADAAWNDQADVVLTQMLGGPSGVSVAQSIQRICHPSGSDANLQTFDIRHVGDALSVRLTVVWSGALGGHNQTVVVWTFDSRAHRSAAVVNDTAAVRTSTKNAQLLNNFFRDEAYPTLRANMGG